MRFFEKYLTLWVALCIVAGITIGQLFGEFFGQCICKKENCCGL